MPKPAWYLTTTNLGPEPDPCLGVVLADLASRFTTSTGPAPADLAAALHLAVTATGHAGDAVATGHLPTDPAGLNRLLAAFNQLAAQATQTLQRLAYHCDRRDLPAMADAPDHLVTDVTNSLAHAGVYAELVAGHLREAELTLTRHPLAAPTA